MKQIGFEELHELLESGKVLPTQVIDVRQPSEYEDGHVPGVVSVPLGQITSEHSNYLEKGKPFYIICQSGGRSLQACVFLTQFGYDVSNVQGGTGAYGSKFNLEK